jgi:N-acetyl-anhydromuramoyl-L-alanine amidase
VRLPRYSIVGGWSSDVERCVSPNADERPDDVEIDLLVVHAISLPPNEFGGDHVSALFSNELNAADHDYFREIEGLRVSSHFFIDRLGRVQQFVSTERRAWHCGESSYRGRNRCNDFSIGIELEGCDELPFDDVQYAALGEITTAIFAAHPKITPERIAGHADIAPGRKTDPGPCFDWPRYKDLIV